MKKTRKILPVSIYDLYGLENWLEQQAKAGLFPVFLNSWVTFIPVSYTHLDVYKRQPWWRAPSSEASLKAA